MSQPYRVTYQSMTAYYELGTVWAESHEEAERLARSKATAFTAGEKSLIKVKLSREAR